MQNQRGQLLLKQPNASKRPDPFVRLPLCPAVVDLISIAGEHESNKGVRPVCSVSRVERRQPCTWYENPGYPLASLLIENPNEDYQETLIGLALLHNSARKLSTDSEAKYNDVRHFGAPVAVAFFDSYFAEGGKTLAEMGYQETVDDNGQFSISRGW